MPAIQRFLQNVKQGYTRGDSVQEQIAENVYLEVSVGSFQHGRVYVRVMVDEPHLSPKEGTYYRQLYTVDEKYQQIREGIVRRIESENETPIENAHEWYVRNPEEPGEYHWLPENLDPQTTIFFGEHVQIRDDVTTIEAIETNKLPENKPDEYKK